MTEHLLQSSFFEWVELQARSIPIFSLFFAIPNGGFRYRTTALELKKEGVKPGVPDVFFACPSGKYAGLFLEFKWGKNSTSKYQDEWIERLRRVGYRVEIVYELDEAIDAVKAYLGCK